MLHYDSGASAVHPLIQADDRLGVVMQGMSTEELYGPGTYVGVHLRCQ